MAKPYSSRPGADLAGPPPVDPAGEPGAACIAPGRLTASHSTLRWVFCLGLIATIGSMGQSCGQVNPDPDPGNQPDPGGNPDSGSNGDAPPVATACGLIGRDCDVSAGGQPWQLDLADIDGDGDLDMVLPLFGNDRVTIWSNNGLGAFTAEASLPALDSPLAVAVTDIDGDARVDIATTGFAAVLGSAVMLILNEGSYDFTSGGNLGIGGGANTLTAGDLDNDGDQDLVTANTLNNTISLLRNNGDGTFATTVNLTAGTVPTRAVMGDFNGDGLGDLAATNRDSDDVSVLLANGVASFAQPVNYAVGDGPEDAITVDLDSDGDLDLAVVNGGGIQEVAQDVSILLNDGSGGFVLSSTVAVGMAPRAIDAGDLDGDGDVDLVVVNSLDITTSVLFNDGVGGFTRTSLYVGSIGLTDVALGDLDGDGDLDVAMCNPSSNWVTLLSNDGTGTFTGGG